MRGTMKKIGIIGCGAIGSEVARAVTEEFNDKAVLFAACDVEPSAVDAMCEKLDTQIPVRSFEGACSEVDLVVEAAVKEAVPGILKEAIKGGSDVVIMSVGGLLDQEELIAGMKEAGLHIYIPSGCGRGPGCFEGRDDDRSRFCSDYHQETPQRGCRRSLHH